MRRIGWMVAALLAGAGWWSAGTVAAQDSAGKAVHDSACIGCHGTGVLGAPRTGDAAAWKARAGGNLAALVSSARAGKGAMPPKGGNAALTDAQLAGAITYMMGMASGAAAPAKPPATFKAAAVPAAEAPAPAAEPAAAAPSAATPPRAAATPVAAVAPTNVNSFNRLLRAPGQRNRPPAEDGIHDATNDGTLALQPPLASFQELPRSNAGNRVDWVKSMRENKIAPRADRLDDKVQPMIMDLNIVREVKGSMPDVVYPHKQHTEWLDCSNCHPAIFKPQKGANQISMASILLGEACGVCHGKVAFPVSECRLCHSKAKPLAANAGAAPAGTAR